MNNNRPYIGDLPSPVIDYLWWQAEYLNPKDIEQGLRDAVAEYRKVHAAPPPPKAKIEAASMPDRNSSRFTPRDERMR